MKFFVEKQMQLFILYNLVYNMFIKEKPKNLNLSSNSYALNVFIADAVYVRIIVLIL